MQKDLMALRTYVRRLVKYRVPAADVDDVTQDVMVAALGRLDTYDPEKSSLKTWVTWQLRATVSAARKRASYRRTAELVLDSNDNDAPAETSGCIPGTEPVDNRALRRAVERLSTRDQDILARRFWFETPSSTPDRMRLKKILTNLRRTCGNEI